MNGSAGSERPRSRPNLRWPPPSATSGRTTTAAPATSTSGTGATAGGSAPPGAPARGNSSTSSKRGSPPPPGAALQAAAAAAPHVEKTEHSLVGHATLGARRPKTQAAHAGAGSPCAGARRRRHSRGKPSQGGGATPPTNTTGTNGCARSSDPVRGLATGPRYQVPWTRCL